MHQTVKALLQRGLTTTLASSLRERGYTLEKLQKLSPAELLKLEVPDDCHDDIRIKSRPAIPASIVHDLLYRSKSVCCVCQHRKLGVQLHHIIPWSKCKKHDEENLVVLCLPCHDNAHTRKGFTKNLTADQLKHHKKMWEQEVREARNRHLYMPRPSCSGGVWDYFNRQRLLGTAGTLQIDLPSLPGYQSLVKDDSNRKDRQYVFEGDLQLGPTSECAFYENVLRSITDKRDWVDLRPIWRKEELRALAPSNTLFALTANFRFKEQTNRVTGMGQTRLGYYQKNNVRLEFSFDAWECTSNSSNSHHLCGSRICTTLGFVRELDADGKYLVLRATSLAIGTGFTDYVGDVPEIALIKQAQRDAEADAWDGSVDTL